jgi:hypothetical protein
MLSNYPIWLAAPPTLDISVYQKIVPNVQVRTFDESFFTGIQGYNRLMMSEEFYQAFSDQEFMLIHQLDVFIFQDELAYWCQQDYDYIGAPWLRDRDFTSQVDQIWFEIKQQMATWLNLKKPDGITPREIITLNGVGNGGLSLRRVSAMLSCLKWFKATMAKYDQISMHQYNEDVFWSVEVNRYWTRLRIPDYRTALHFSIEFFPQWAVEHYNHGQLPFGCHAWNIHGTDYWRPIFARYGYQI